MKVYTKLLLICGLMVSFSTNNACSPEDGQDGVMGPQGIAGQDGADGQDGNANVQTGTVDLVNEDWLWQGSYTFNHQAGGFSSSWFTRYADLDIPEIDADIDQNGVVLVYFKASLNGGWQPLPFLFTSFGNGYFTHIVYETSVENIRLHYFWTENKGATPGGLATYEIADHSFKYVIIEGTAVGKNSSYSKTDFSKMTYEEVMDHFGLDY